MALPNGTVVAKIVIKTTQAIRRSTLYYQLDGGAPTVPADMSIIADAVFLKFQEKWCALMPEDHKFLRVEARYYSSSDLDIEGNSTHDSADGALANTTGPSDSLAAEGTQGLPDEVSLIVQRRTGHNGRSKNGRIFVCGLSEQVQENGTVAAAFKGACKDLANIISDDVHTDSTSTLGDVTMHARHYDRKNGTLIPVMKGYAIATMGTRKDRRRPLELERL